MATNETETKEKTKEKSCCLRVWVLVLVAVLVVAVVTAAWRWRCHWSCSNRETMQQVIIPNVFEFYRIPPNKGTCIENFKHH
jgi:hypothetical protein